MYKSLDYPEISAGWDISVVILERYEMRKFEI